MAKSKRIIVTICAVLITFVMCTVSANAMDINSYENGTDNLYVSTTPISHITFIQNTINSTEINYVGGTPMQSFVATSNGEYAFPEYLETPILNGEEQVQFQLSYNISDWQGNIPETLWMGMNGLNTQYFGTTITNNNIEQRVLIAQLSGGDFIYERSLFDVSGNGIRINWNENNTSELTAQNNFIITFLTTRQDANGYVSIIPITIEGSQQYQYGEVIEGQITYTTIPLVFSEEAVDEAIRVSTVIDDETKAQLYNAEYFYVESYRTTFSVSENLIEEYDFRIIQRFKETTYPPQDIAIYEYPFVDWMESLPSARMPEPVAFNLLETIIENLDGALSVPIIGELSIGWILWICVAIGALFGILKYFAGG